jgi:hypothetical protein
VTPSSIANVTQSRKQQLHKYTRECQHSSTFCARHYNDHHIIVLQLCAVTRIHDLSSNIRQASAALTVILGLELALVPALGVNSVNLKVGHLLRLLVDTSRAHVHESLRKSIVITRPKSLKYPWRRQDLYFLLASLAGRKNASIVDVSASQECVLQCKEGFKCRSENSRALTGLF